MNRNLPTSTKESNRALGHHLRVYRTAADLTQAQLGALSGVTPETVSNVERGAVHPSPLTRRALATALGVDVDVLWPASKNDNGSAARGAAVKTGEDAPDAYAG